MEPIDLRGVSMGQQLLKAIDKMHNGLLAAIDEINELKLRVEKLEHDAGRKNESEGEPPVSEVS